MNAHGTANKVKVGFFSFTEITDPGEHRAYNEWHQLDHLPEQYPLGGLAFGQRWVSTPACAAARKVNAELLAPIHYVTLYLMTEPVDDTLEAFMQLGQRLHELGRFHQHRRARLSGPLDVADTSAAARVLVSPQAVPFRPNRGVYVIVEEPGAASWPLDHVVDVDGVAGAWSFRTNARYNAHRWRTGDRRVVVCYLDDEPLRVAPAIDRVLDKVWGADPSIAAVFAGPFETIEPWKWDWFD